MARMISENFSIEEFYANSATAKKLGLTNVPDEKSKQCIIELVKNVLQPIRTKYGKSIGVNCGYRCPQVNKAVGGSTTSQHMYGQAADIRAVRTTNAELFWLIYDMIKNGDIVVGQLIWEFGSKTEPGWIHVSSSYSKKNNIIRAVKINGKTSYVPFDLKR